MCGIAGLLPWSEGRLDASLLKGMCHALTHRGPDDWGIALGAPGRQFTNTSPHETYFPSPTRVGLASTRLSIIDLSSAGHMPMATAGNRTWIAYNGEIYNFMKLRQELESRGCRFRSNTDTEVILQLFEQEGPACFERLNGMFALAIWDSATQSLYLARDRFGVKPLYYAFAREGFVFASEFKAMWGAGIDTEIDLESLNRYLSFLYVPKPATMLKSIRRVPPGAWMRIKAGEREAHPQFFWRLKPPADAGEPDEREVIEQIREKVRTAVLRQTVGDVPISAFLSGGIDSSTIVASLVNAGRPPKSVHSIGFSDRDRRQEGGAEDLPYAKRFAASLGLKYDELVLRPDVAGLLPKLVWHMDEPIADPAIIPAFLVSQRASRESKVLLSGMGCDEYFGGYRRHLTPKLLDASGRIPRALSMAVGPIVESLPNTGVPHAATLRHLKKLWALRDVPIAQQLVQACAWMDSDTRMGLYNEDIREQLQPDTFDAVHRAALCQVRDADPVTQMLFLDTTVYLPGHNLAYTDKMSMAASVEVRVPFLDNDLVDYVFSLPLSMKIRGFNGKYALKKALKGILPDEILTRPKTGFAAPIRSWLKEDLREMVGDLLSPRRIAARSIFNPQAVTALQQARNTGASDQSYNIWALLTLELWMQQVLDVAPTVEPLLSHL